MNQIQLQKLNKRLCFKEGCSGYLFETHDHQKNNILRCTECYGFIYQEDADVLLLQGKRDYPQREEEQNLSELNNL